MKKIVSIFIICFAFLSSGINAKASIAVVNMDTVIQKSQVWQGVKNDIESYADLVQKQVMLQQATLEDIWAKIKQIRSGEMQSNELIKLEKSFKDGRAKSQRYVQQQKKKMDRAFSLAKNAINKEINSIVKKIAVKENFSIVLNSSSSKVVYAKDNVVITKRVLNALDSNLPRIELQFKENNK